MAAEQQHGKSFERLVIDETGLFPRAEGVVFGPTEDFDIPADRTENGIPVSIKSRKSSPWSGGQPVIEMGDARRFLHHSTRAPMRIIAGLYRQEGAWLRVYEIHDLHLDPSMAPWLWGDLQETEIAAFVRAIEDWAAEDDAAGVVKRDRAQAKARRHKSRMLPRAGLVALNQKINTTNRRLQCSINLFHLHNACRQYGTPARIVTDEDPDPTFGRIRLPLRLPAGARSRRVA